FYLVPYSLHLFFPLTIYDKYSTKYNVFLFFQVHIAVHIPVLHLFPAVSSLFLLTKSLIDCFFFFFYLVLNVFLFFLVFYVFLFFQVHIAVHIPVLHLFPAVSSLFLMTKSLIDCFFFLFYHVPNEMLHFLVFVRLPLSASSFEHFLLQ